AGEQLIRSMHADPEGRFWPVGLIDDDPAKRRLRLHGVPVRGGMADIPAVAGKTNATILVVAMANADAAMLRRLVDLTAGSGIEIKVLPTVPELVNSQVGVGDVRDLDDEDLLGRKQVQTDLDALAHFVHGRRVLVTGAGGSIGS